MTIFLTSSPCIDDVPEGVDLPCVLNEANEFVEKLSSFWKPESRGLIMSSDPMNFAMNNEMCQTFLSVFSYHGLSLTGVEVCDFRNESDAASLVEDSDFIILSGGHVPTQNAFFQRIGLKKLLENYQGIIIGISAGSMNSAEIVYAQPEEEGEAVDPSYEKFIPGLGLTKVMICPHYQKTKDNELDGMRLFEEITYPDSMGQKFYALEDGSYVLISEGRTELYGEAWLIQDGELSKFCEMGEKVELECE